MLRALHAALRVGLEQTTGGSGQRRLVKPGVAGHSGHEKDQIGRKRAALGDHAVGLKAHQLVAKAGADAAACHLGQQVLNRLRSEAAARLGGGVEEHDVELVAPALAPELLINAEQKLEHRSPAHGTGLVGVAGKAHGNGAAGHGTQAVTDTLGRRNAFARRDGVFNARQFFDEAPTAGNHQCVVAQLASRGEHHPATVLKTGDLGSDVVHLHARKKVGQRNHQLLAGAQPRRNPDDARQVVQLGAWCHQGDVRIGVALANFPHGGQGAKAGANDGDVSGRLHGVRFLTRRRVWWGASPLRQRATSACRPCCRGGCADAGRVRSA